MLLVIYLLIIATCVFCDIKILLLHTNDMHARFREVDRHLGNCKDNSSQSCYGGFARIHEMVRKIRKEAEADGRSTFFVNAGDNYQGTPYYSVYKWPIVAEFMNALGVDVMSLGNHEFDDGIDGLAPYIKNLTVPVVCCNMDWSQETSLQGPNLTPSKVFNVNGTKIGVIGYLTPNVSKGNTGRLRILNEIGSVRAEAQNLMKQGIGILIALGHSGYDRDLIIAREVEDIDLVVGGHTHSFLYSGTPPDIEKPIGPYPTVVTQASGKKVPVVQAFFGTKYLGQLNLNFDLRGNLVSYSGSPVLLKGNLPQSKTILQKLAGYETGIKDTQRIIGYTHVFLDNADGKCRMAECNIGNMITDAYVDYAKQCKKTVGWTAAAIGVTQAGSIRASIDDVSEGRNGSITLEDVMTVIPFGNRVVVIRLLGSLLLEALEKSVARYEYIRTAHVKEFLQVSGLRVIYDMNREAGRRVVQVKVLCADCKMPRFEYLNQTKTYGVVLPEYLAKGGSNFPMLAGHKYECVFDYQDYMIVAKYIESCSPLNPRIESRILITKGNPYKIVATIVGICLIVAFSLYFFNDKKLKMHLKIPFKLQMSKNNFTFDNKEEEHERLFPIQKGPIITSQYTQ